jgi:hypothetical protein
MAYVTPGTVAAGDVATAAAWNVLVANDVTFSPIAGAWTAWTPSRSGVTIGNGVEVARYMLVGKTCAINYRLTLGTTSSVSGDIQISLPFGEKTVLYPFGSFSGPSNVDVASNITVVSTTMYLRAINVSGTYASTTNCSATIPFTWATGNTIQAAFVYETS